MTNKTRIKSIEELREEFLKLGETRRLQRFDQLVEEGNRIRLIQFLKEAGVELTD